ncbi:MAG: hypothetical protein AAGG01_23280, partial [Planctomycetota bacterium]
MSGGGSAVRPRSAPAGPSAFRPDDGGALAPSAPAGPAAAGASTGDTSRDLSHWSFWWVLENQRFLDLNSTWSTTASPSGSSVARTGRLRPSYGVIQRDVLPRIWAQLGATEHPDVVSSALIALARTIDPQRSDTEPVRAVLQDHLWHSHRRVAESAALGLGLLGTEEAGDRLAELITGDASESTIGGWLDGRRPSSRLRAFAAHGLGLASERVNDSAARRRWAIALVNALEDSNAPTVALQVAAIQALGVIELGQQDVLDAEAVTGPHADRVASDDALATFLLGWSERSSGRSSWVRTHAAAAAGRAAARASEDVRAEIIAALTKMTRDRKIASFIRTGAAIGIGEAANSGRSKADRSAREALVSLMKRGQPLESRFARVALAQAASRPSADEEPFHGATAARRILINDLVHSRSDELGWAALALGGLEWRLHRAGLTTPTDAAAALARMGKKRRGDDSSAALGLGLALTINGMDDAQRFEEHLLAEFRDVSSPLRRSFLAVALGVAGTPAAGATLYDELKGSSG